MLAGAQPAIPITVIWNNARSQRCVLVQTVAQELGIALLEELKSLLTRRFQTFQEVPALEAQQTVSKISQKETVSPAWLTRLLQGDWSGSTLREFACRTLLVWRRGYLILGGTVIPKPFATGRESLAWVFSIQESKPVYSLSLVLLIRELPSEVPTSRGGPCRAWMYGQDLLPATDVGGGNQRCA